MDIREAIDVLQALGFHMFRKILFRKTLVGAAFVYMPFDVYCRLINDGGTTYLDFGSGEWHDVEGLEDYLPTLLTQFVAARESADRPGASESASALEDAFPEKLAETEKHSGRKLDFLWQGANGCWMGLYRGAVLEINNHLRVVSIDGGSLVPQNRLFGFTEKDTQAGMSLRDAFGVIDESGGYEEIPVDVDALEA